MCMTFVRFLAGMVGAGARADAGELNAHLGYNPRRQVSKCDVELFLGPGLAGLPRVRTQVTNSIKGS
jgi:hypothetical protein